MPRKKRITDPNDPRFGEDNKVFTRSRYEAAKARLNARLAEQAQREAEEKARRPWWKFW